MGASVVVGTKELAVEPGAEVGTDVIVRNSGTVVDEFRIEVLGEAAGYGVSEPPVIRLFPGTEQTVRVTFRPPRLFTTKAGAHPFGVRATPQEDPGGSATDEGTVTVGEFDEIVGELVPRTVRGRRSARTELAVDNRGNVALNARLQGLDPDGQLHIDIDPPTLTGEPGTATFFKVRLKPARSFLRGPAKSYNYQVAIVEEGAPPVVVDGSMLQDALLPKWLWKALLALLLLLLLLLALWHLLLKPKIESEATRVAKKEAAKAVAPLQSDVNQAKKDAAAAKNDAAAAKGDAAAAKEAAEGGGGGGGGGGKPTTTTTPLVAAKPIDFRLAVSSPAASSTTVKKDFEAAKQNFSMTDIVLQNPNGDHGTLTISRGTDPKDVILVINLDNFRDLDYHYVAPIVFDNKALVMKVDCTGGGNAGGGQPAATCTPAASISGYITGP